MTFWHIHSNYPNLQQTFSSLDAVFKLQGEPLTHDRISEVIRVQHHGTHYYIKRYHAAGKGLRKWFGRPRIKGEALNLQRFSEWGIPTATVVAWGMEAQPFWKNLSHGRRGAMITLGIPETTDLAILSQTNDARLKDKNWVRNISAQLAKITRTMHAQSFTHNDLKWRNLLVDAQNHLYLIDCPSGNFWYGKFLEYRIIKDIACLDKIAKHHLSRTQRLRFYLNYIQQPSLDSKHKAQVRKIIQFFEGRE